MIEDEITPEEPKDRYRFAYITFLFLGMAILLPWNAILMSLDYFILRFPDHDVDFLVSILSNGPLFATNLLMIIIGPYFPEKRTIGVTMVLTMVLVLSLPIYSEVLATRYTAWVLVFITIIVMSAINGIMQCWTYGFAGAFPGNYIGTLNTGAALSGLSIGVLRAISLLIFPPDDDITNPNFFYGALMHFTISAITTIFGIIFLILLPRTKFFSYHMEKRNEQINAEEQIEGSFGDTTINLTEDMIDKSQKKAVSCAYMLKIHNQLLLTGYGVALIFIQTFLVFPGVMLQGGIDFIPNISWEVRFVIFLFEITDTISRYVSEHFMILNERTAALATLLRFIPIAFAFLSAFEISIFTHDAFKITNFWVIGFTNGYISNWQFMIAVKKAKIQDKGITSKFMSVFLVFGIAIGSIISSFGVTQFFD